MSNQYDLSNYTPAVVPTAYARDIKQLVLMAISVGWTLHVTSGSAMRLVSPKGEKVIQLNLSKKSHPLVQYRRWVQQYANPLLAPHGKSDAEIEKKAHQIVHGLEVRANTEALKAAENLGASGIVEAHKMAEEIDLSKVVVYEGPMRSSRSHGKGKRSEYESDIANEIQYGDGRRVLTCVRCDYQGSVPLSMSSHWQVHVREDRKAKGGHEGPKAVPVIRPDSEYHPRAERLASLKEALIEAMTQVNWGDIDGAAEILAMKALEWDHERRMTHGDPTEMTPEQVLDRIRGLVDGGKYAERLEEIQSLRHELVESRERFEQVEAERDKARDYVSTLRELLNQEDA
jgi:hypothetical protein